MGSVRSVRDIDSALCKKGFRRTKGGDHIYFFLTGLDGLDVGIKTKISHGVTGATIGSPLISQMSRQLHLTKAQFLDLVDCPLDEAGYRAILDGQGETA